jgi:hypothetical protein
VRGTNPTVDECCWARRPGSLPLWLPGGSHCPTLRFASFNSRSSAAVWWLLPVPVQTGTQSSALGAGAVPRRRPGSGPWLGPTEPSPFNSVTAHSERTYGPRRSDGIRNSRSTETDFSVGRRHGVPLRLTRLPIRQRIVVLRRARGSVERNVVTPAFSQGAVLPFRPRGQHADGLPPSP